MSCFPQAKAKADQRELEETLSFARKRAEKTLSKTPKREKDQAATGAQVVQEPCTKVGHEPGNAQSPSHDLTQSKEPASRDEALEGQQQPAAQ